MEHICSTDNLIELKEDYRNIACNYLQQKVSLLSISDLLEENSIEHAIYKGGHTRELVYQHPAVRPSSDIDILINFADRDEVVRLMTSRGFLLYTKTKNLTHELSLIKGNTSIDLHWHILRPGRIPESLTSDLLSDRVKQDEYWSLSNDAHLFILLIHPVFTKYCSTTQNGLIRMLDLLYWFKNQSVEWGGVLNLLNRTGLKTAAWITLEYLSILTGVSIPENVMNEISPGCLKKRYLQKWIYTDLPARLQRRPFWVKTAFTLFAHDDMGGTFRFLRARFR